MSKKKWTRAALVLSSVLFVLWWLLGTSATLAWFSDTDEVRNEFRIGLLDLDVSFKNDWITEYTPLENSSEVFSDHALYEPGYTQIVYLKIENKGDVDFNYKMSVTVNRVTKSVSVLGNEIYLPNYLRYGAVFAETEAEVQELVAQRLQSWDHTDTYMLDTWSKDSEYTFEAGEDPHYAALIVYMPTEVTNVANYRGSTAPQVELGITVYAQQAGTG